MKKRLTSKVKSRSTGLPLRMEQLEARRVLATVTLNTDLGLPGELRTAIGSAASGETIDFQLAAGSETILLSLGELAIDRSLIIDGANLAGSGLAVTINAGGLSRVMNVDDGNDGVASDVSLRSLTIRGGNTSTTVGDADGGGIRSTENLEIVDSLVTGNFSADDGGGIVNYSGSSLRIIDSAIDGNSTEDRGGGVAFALGTATISGSSISGNTINTAIGSALGGGMFIGSGATVSIDNSSVNDNDAMTTYVDPVNGLQAGRGAGIYVSGFGAVSPTQLTITGSEVNANDVVGQGGGIQAGQGVKLRVENSSVSDNSATGDGGGIAVSSFNEFTDAETTILGSTISGNSAGDDGGALEIASAMTVVIDDTTIDNNYAYSRGGAIYTRGEYAGSTRYLAELTITNSRVTSNRAADDGGGIHAGRVTNTILDETTIADNSVDSRGGGLRFSFATNANTASTATITNSLISGNFSVDDGGGVYIAQGFVVDISNTTIDGNSTGDDGAGLQLRSNAVVTIEDSRITNNIATGGGGGIYNLSNVRSTIRRSTVSGNIAGAFGGGMWSTSGADVVVERSTFSGNTANGGGGAADTTGAAILINESTISGNRVNGASGFGGGLYFALDPADPVIYQQRIANSTITENESAVAVGGIYVSSTAMPVITGSIVSGNIDPGITPDIYGTVVPSYSLIGDNSGTYLLESQGDADGNIIGGPIGGPINAQLSPLQDNGGPTQTHIPLAGSPVIDRGDPSIMGGTDQRGFTRVEDGDAMPGARIDMGSVEFGGTQSTGCDIDGNGSCDEIDLRAIYDAIAAMASGGPADIDASGTVDNADIPAWLMLAGSANGKVYRAGDTNLDGNVGGADFTTVASNFGASGLPGAYWDQGNFDGNSGGLFAVGGADFTSLASNFGFTSPLSAPTSHAFTAAPIDLPMEQPRSGEGQPRSGEETADWEEAAVDAAMRSEVRVNIQDVAPTSISIEWLSPLTVESGSMARKSSLSREAKLDRLFAIEV